MPGSKNPAVLAARFAADVRFGTAGRRRGHRRCPAARGASKYRYHCKVRPARGTGEEEGRGNAGGSIRMTEFSQRSTARFLALKAGLISCSRGSWGVQRELLVRSLMECGI